jgi:hypothetical protein
MYSYLDEFCLKLYYLQKNHWGLETTMLIQTFGSHYAYNLKRGSSVKLHRKHKMIYKVEYTFLQAHIFFFSFQYFAGTEIIIKNCLDGVKYHDQWCEWFKEVYTPTTTDPSYSLPHLIKLAVGI